MTNLQKYDNAFIEVFNVVEHNLNPGLEYQSIPAWDSVGHMSLMAALEEAFNIMFDTDDIIDFSSYAKGKELLQKYEISL
jgi:acyl carrier protein